MAGCYHDELDFDPTIEVARGSDILEDGQDLDGFKNCTKNPKHEGFIPFKDLTLEHLPIEHRNRKTLDMITKMGSRVVKLVVDNENIGTGFVISYINQYYIQTNNHVVKSDYDVEHCTVEFHYDDFNDRSKVKISHGVKLSNTCPQRDFTLFQFHPVPDHILQLKNLKDDERPTIVIMYKNNQIESETIAIKSNPSQIVPIFVLKLNSSLIHLMFIAWDDDSVSYLKCSYFKFEPIPSNRPLFTALEILFCYGISKTQIEIHIDEDDGNSRVIPGVVVKLGDEFVVKISESIFQDKVKKCKLVWKGEVIGLGTRLYFHSGATLSGYPIWDCDYDPKPKDVSHSVDIGDFMCCISHPHGAMKMVSFGKLLGGSSLHERDVTDPRISVQFFCLHYSCLTCPGSSGSPVFFLQKKYGFRRDYGHFKGKPVEPYESNGELIENENTAFLPKSHDLLPEEVHEYMMDGKANYLTKWRSYGGPPT